MPPNMFGKKMLVSTKSMTKSAAKSLRARISKKKAKEIVATSSDDDEAAPQSPSPHLLRLKMSSKMSKMSRKSKMSRRKQVKRQGRPNWRNNPKPQRREETSAPSWGRKTKSSWADGWETIPSSTRKRWRASRILIRGRRSGRRRRFNLI